MVAQITVAERVDTVRADDQLDLRVQIVHVAGRSFQLGVAVEYPPEAARISEDSRHLVDAFADGYLVEARAGNLLRPALAILGRHHPVTDLVNFVAHENDRDVQQCVL